MRTFSFVMPTLFLICLSAHGQTTFTDVTASAGTGLGDGTARGFSWVDFDNDGLIDLFIPTAGNVPNKVYKNNGDGTFSEIAAALGLNDMANTITCSWADFDNDGDLDLITTATAAATTLWRNNFFPGGDTSFTNITARSGIAMSGAQMPAWADYNLDGFLDVYSSISNSSVSTDALYRNNGDTTFTNVADSAGVNHQVSGVLEQAVHWGDFDRDGDPDLFIGNLQTGGPSYFHRNNGDGTFSEIAATLGFQGAARGSQWVDYNSDGLRDFSVAGYSGGTAPVPVKLYRNNGDGTFTDVAAQAGITDAVISWGVTWADFNNDGYEDFFVNVSGQSTSCLLYQNNGNGTFSNVTSQAGLPSFAQLSAAWGDYDNDGDMDLYTSGAASAGNHLFRNNSDTTKKWLKINLTAGLLAGNNSFGVGAQIEVKAGSLRMLREVNTAIGYRSQNMMTAHFGLDTNSAADSVIIYWPIGIKTIYTNLHANRTYKLGEFPPLSVGEPEIAHAFHLGQNYPNPFNPSTQIRFEIPVSGIVRLKVYDILGREVAILVDGVRSAGTHSFTWNAERLGSGVYFSRLEAGGLVQTKKMQLLK